MRWTTARNQGAERRRQDDRPPVGGLASAFQCLQDDDDVVQRGLVELPATPQGIHVQFDVPVDPLGRIVVLGIPGQTHGVPDASEVAGAVCRERRLDTDELRRADHPVHVHQSRQPSGPSIAVEPRVDGHQVEVEQGRPNQGVGARGTQPPDERPDHGRDRGGVRRKVEPASGRDRHAAIGSPLVSFETAQHGGVELLQAGAHATRTALDARVRWPGRVPRSSCGPHDGPSRSPPAASRPAARPRPRARADCPRSGSKRCSMPPAGRRPAAGASAWKAGAERPEPRRPTSRAADASVLRVGRSGTGSARSLAIPFADSSTDTQGHLAIDEPPLHVCRSRATPTRYGKSGSCQAGRSGASPLRSIAHHCSSVSRSAVGQGNS